MRDEGLQDPVLDRFPGRFLINKGDAHIFGNQGKDNGNAFKLMVYRKILNLHIVGTQLVL